MPSRRRFRALITLSIILVVIFLLYTASRRSPEDTSSVGDFYHKTKNALENKKSDVKGANGKSPEDQEVSRQMSERLKEAAQVAKDNANAKAPKPDPPSEVVGVGSAAEGAREDKLVGKKRKGTGDSQAPIKEENKEDHAVEDELNSILKKSPSKSSQTFHSFKKQGANWCLSKVIVFSKSYCPHSARAKRILLEKYIIDPKPFVVELDQHPLGLNLQSRLEEITGRRTVPNVLVNGKSIGGGDDVAALDDSDELVKKIKELGGKRMVDVRPVLPKSN
jgi:glutaredoxin